MNESYVTNSLDCIKTYPGLGTKRLIQINTHPNRFVLLKNVSNQEWRDLGNEFNNSIFEAHNRTLEQTNSKLGVIHAFDFDITGQSAFSHLQTEWIVSKLESSLNLTSSRDVINHLRCLSEIEQINLWRSLKPKTLEEYEAAMRAKYMQTIYTLDIRAIVHSFSFRDGIDYLVSTLSKPSFGRDLSQSRFSKTDQNYIKYEGYKQKTLQFLVFLQAHGYILFSIGAYLRLLRENRARHGKGTNTGLIALAVMNSPKVNLQVKSLIRSGEHDSKSDSKEALILSCWFLMSTSVSDIGDLSTELFDEAVSFKTRHYKWFNSFIETFNNDGRYSKISFPHPKRVCKNSKGTSAKTRSLEWARTTHPNLCDWIDAIESYVKKRYVTYTTLLYVQAGYILSYLGGLEDPPTVNNLNGNTHVRSISNSAGSRTFRDFLDQWRIQTGPRKGKPLETSTKIGALNFFKNLMDKVCQDNIERIALEPSLSGTLLTKNPISELDTIWKNSKSVRTHRTSLKQDYIDLAKHILLSPDKNGKPTFEWVRNHPAFKYDWIKINIKTKASWPWINKEGNNIRYWQPSRALALYTLLELPLRSFQARWLDSGIADEKYWDFSKNALITNKRHQSSAGRKMGVFQPISSSNLTNKPLLGFYVSTNKTQIWNPEDFQGFTVPWPNMDFYKNIQIQREWIDLISENFFTESVSLADDNLDVNKTIKDLLPKFHPLFRDVSCAAGMNLPITKSKINALWVLLCNEIQSRLSKQNVNIQLVKEATQNAEKDILAVYDLHSLRVSGVTNLALKGVPIDVISSYIVGHSSIAMTLHYEKKDPTEIRKQLLNWITTQQKLANVEDMNALIDLIDGKSDLPPANIKKLVGVEWFRRFLITNNTPQNNAIEMLGSSQGQWAINIDGICPGAKCEEGDLEGGLVKGGARRCGNCKFFITGTAFLYGQAHKSNLVMYEMKMLGDDLVRWRGIKRQFDPESRDYEQASTRIAEIEDKLEGVMGDWWGRYRLFQTSLNLLEQSTAQSKTKKNQLITQGDPTEVKVIIKKTNKVELIKELALSTELLSVDLGNKGPEIELREILNVILTSNGVKPFLIGLPAGQSLHITNQVADAMLEIFEANNEGNRSLAFEEMLKISNNESGVTISERASKNLRLLAKKFESSSKFMSVRDSGILDKPYGDV